MKSAILLLFASLAALPATMNLQPAVIVDCTYGLGVTQVNWSGASGPVTVRVISATGPPLTGLSDPAGSALTGVWVRDAMQFFLVNQAGVVEATAIAHVDCATGARTIDAGLHGASYFPLQVGNTWVYRENSRAATGTYVIRTITGTQVINGLIYYDLTSDGNLLGELRQDANGAVYILSGGTEQVYVDPVSSVFQPTTYSSPLGTFTDALRANVFGGLQITNSTFVRGLGIVHADAQLVTGSSGGFLSSIDLVEVRMPGVRLSTTNPDVALTIGLSDIDLTNKTAPNCALPCYFVACGLGGPPPDPAGTYKPCIESRIEAHAKPGDVAQLQLLAPTGAQLFTASATADPSGHILSYIRLPLFTGASTVLPPGQYKVTLAITEASAQIAASNIQLSLR